MVKTKEELIGQLREKIGDGIGDADIALLEDITDTLDDMATKANDTTNWKEKYEELDRTWRQKYIDRFNDSVESDTDEVHEEAGEVIEEYEAPKTYEDLFTVKGE